MAGHKKYSREFKLQALGLVNTSGKRISELEREPGITAGLQHKWKARHAQDGVQAFPGNGRLKEEEEAVRRLRRELEVVTQERDILKKHWPSSQRSAVDEVRLYS